MDDRQLLEDAARAAGIEWQSYHMSRGLCLAPPKGGMVITQMWNPLTDDGDALRLAVKLRMDIMVDFDRVDVTGQGGAATEYLYKLPKPTDLGVATRRAITSAAAAIGRQMREAGNG